jgi:hypothetical protein
VQDKKLGYFLISPKVSPFLSWLEIKI